MGIGEQLTDNKEQVPGIAGVDMAKGIAMTGGTLDAYRQVLTIFCEDAEERLPLLQTVPEESGLPAFVINVHALKSACASIGAADISARAAGLEAAGRAGDTAFVRENLSIFAERLAELTGGIRTWEKAMEERGSEKPAGGLDHETVMSLLHEFAAALKLQKANDIDRILEQLTRQAWTESPADAGIKSALEQISNEVLMAEYERAGEILDGVLEGKNSQ